jgi:hypothetical protein
MCSFPVSLYIRGTIYDKYATTWLDFHHSSEVSTFHKRKSVSRPSIAISYHISCARSSSSSMFGNTEYVDARRSTFNNVGSHQVIINPNSLGAMQDHSCTVACSFSMIPDTRSQGTAKPGARCHVRQHRMRRRMSRRHASGSHRKDQGVDQRT